MPPLFPQPPWPEGCAYHPHSPTYPVTIQATLCNVPQQHSTYSALFWGLALPKLDKHLMSLHHSLMQKVRRQSGSGIFPELILRPQAGPGAVSQALSLAGVTATRPPSYPPDTATATPDYLGLIIISL